MSMLDSFFNKGFKAAKCKTLLKLTIPRIKLLRNRREIQLKQMRRDIAKLLETGQEATARIRVEHIIREEKMMAAQDVIELFCELITVRLPIIEAQRECPLDLKEAISSVCFAAPRCADLPELLQAQMLFAGKYGKEFVSAATELMPECGVNRQLVELLSVRAPDPDVKLKLLKEIAEEHELDWDPASSETELLKTHEDLLNGPTQSTSGSEPKLPLPKENHEASASLNTGSEEVPNEGCNSDAEFDIIDFPEVPKASIRSRIGTGSALEMLPFPEVHLEPAKDSDANESLLHVPSLEHDEVLQENSVANDSESHRSSFGSMEKKQFVPFMSPPSPPSLSSSVSFSERQCEQPKPPPRTHSETNVDLQDVLAAAQAAAESAELAAAAARSVADLALVRITELVKKKSDETSNASHEKPFHEDICEPVSTDKLHLSPESSSPDTSEVSNSPIPDGNLESKLARKMSNLPLYNTPEVEFDSFPLDNDVPGHYASKDDEPYFSYPNLFTRQDSNAGSGVNLTEDNALPTHHHL